MEIINRIAQDHPILVDKYLVGKEIEVDYFSHVRKSTRWKFKLHPRKLQMTVIYLVLTPFVFIKSGYCGVIEGWEHAYDVQSWSSYSIWSNEMPSKFECYSRF